MLQISEKKNDGQEQESAYDAQTIQKDLLSQSIYWKRAQEILILPPFFLAYFLVPLSATYHDKDRSFWNVAHENKLLNVESEPLLVPDVIVS